MCLPLIWRIQVRVRQVGLPTVDELELHSRVARLTPEHCEEAASVTGGEPGVCVVVVVVLVRVLL